jgi:thiamine-phosphate pyrophosphorylase
VKLARIRLARAAAALNRSRGTLPPLVLMTDDERLTDPVAAARALPRGSMVVVRARQSSHRAKLAQSLRAIARARGLTLLIGNDPALADRVRAAGIHLSEDSSREAAIWRAKRPRWLITAAAHSLAGCACAHRRGADAAFLAPVFGTASHPDGAHLGAMRAKAIARVAPLAVYALGGLNAQTAARLTGSRFVGLAAIGGLARDRQDFV